MTASDQEVIDIELISLRDEVSWVVEVSYSWQGKDGVLEINDNGKPFVLSTITNATGYEPESGAGQLVRAPHRDAGAPSGRRPNC